MKNRCPLKAGSRQPGLAQRMRNLMPTNAETVSRRPEIVIVGHNQCQAEPVSSPCRFPLLTPRHQSGRFRNSTLVAGESTGGRHWLGLALVMPNDDDFGTPRKGLGICGHQIPHALSQTRLPTACLYRRIVQKRSFSRSGSLELSSFHYGLNSYNQAASRPVRGGIEPCT